MVLAMNLQLTLEGTEPVPSASIRLPTSKHQMGEMLDERRPAKLPDLAGNYQLGDHS
jgi:hypothetical protein